MALSRRVVVQLRAGSDGDPTQTPNPERYRQLSPPTLYLEKLGDQWMQSRGEAKPGVKYILAGLPAGYTLWERPRPKEPTHLDRYLYGHPSRKVFDSPNRFFVHFKHLMDHGDSIGCLCTVCSGSSGVLPKKSTKLPGAGSTSSTPSSRPASSHGPAQPSTTTVQSRATQYAGPFAVPALALAPPKVSAQVPSESARPPGRSKLVGPGMDASRVDEEGTPDVWRNLINKLRRHGRIDEVIEQLFSMDWRAEQDLLPELIRKIEKSHQWIPRVGDIVLFVRTLPKDVHIIRHPIKGDYRMYDDSTKLWLERPAWEAGLIGQTPTETITIEDLSTNGDKEGIVTNFGVRVEPLPDVNSSDKSISKRHKYIPVRHVRPFVLWKQLLNQVTEWHPTIKNALAVTSVFSLTGKYRFKGTWPEALIYCRGIYIGHEMLAVGDTVRLSPNAAYDQVACTDILVIKTIRLNLYNLDKASDNDWDEGRPYNSNVWVHGAAYTSDPDRVNKAWLSDAYPPAPAHDYGEWYPLHPPNKELAVPFCRIIGRLHELDAMKIWLDTRSSDNNALLLDAGREALTESRMFSQAHNKRIAREPGTNWFWGDHRAQSLDLHTINGLDVAAHDPLRDPKDWRRKLKALPEMGGKKIPPAAAKPGGAASLAGRNLRGFMAPALPDLHVRSQASAPRLLRTPTVSSDASTLGAEEGTATQVRGKRPAQITGLSSEEENEEDEINKEIKRTMRVVSDRGKAGVKRPRVEVVVE